jgi:hypothetical protein
MSDQWLQSALHKAYQQQKAFYDSENSSRKSQWVIFSDNPWLS